MFDMYYANQSFIGRPLPFMDASGHVDHMQERFLGWNVPPEDSEIVHPHWRAFISPAKYWHISLALIYFMLMITSYVGNGCVVYIFSTSGLLFLETRQHQYWRHLRKERLILTYLQSCLCFLISNRYHDRRSKVLRTPSNMFVINHALFDLLMAVEMPLLLANSFVQRIFGGPIACDIYATLGSISGIGSAINNAAIAFDRYRTISCPIDGRLNGKQAALIIFITWFWSLPFTVLPALKVWCKFVAEGFLTTCSFDYLTDDQDTKVFVVAIFIWSYAFPLILIVYFYAQLIKSVQTHEKMLREQAKKMNVKSLVSNQDKERSVEMKIAKVAFTIFFLFLISWTPYTVVAFVGAFGNRSLLTPISTMLPAVFAKSVSCIDPWVYAINHPRYRQELQKRCKWMGLRDNTPSNVSDSTSAQTERVKSDDA